MSDVQPARIDERLAEQVADVMFALSSPVRVQILGCLLGGPRPVGELVDALGLEQSAVSHQLRVLREHAIVQADRVGRQRLYALHDSFVASLLEDALGHVEQRHHQRRRVRRARRAVGEG